MTLAVVATSSVALAATPAGAAGRHHHRHHHHRHHRYHQRMTVRIVAHVNAIRAAHGMRRLRADRSLRRAAAEHSREMVRYRFFSHGSPTGRSLDARLRAPRLGETLAWASGRPSSRRIVRMWMHSPEHRATLLSPGYRAIGVAPRTDRMLGRRGTVVTADLAG